MKIMLPEELELLFEFPGTSSTCYWVVAMLVLQLATPLQVVKCNVCANASTRMSVIVTLTAAASLHLQL